MKLLLKLPAAIISGFLLFTHSGFTLAETDHQHNHAQNQHAVTDLSLNHGEKWKTDAPLRQGMQSINASVKNAVEDYHQQKLTKAQSAELATQINAQVNYMVENCKLEPAADATLHVLIGDLLNAADKVSKDPMSGQGMPQLVKTLMLYPKYFDHPGWTGIIE